jgi:signal recognition particle subunit SRP54
MTPAERRNPKILNGSRRSRIAKGSGTSVGEVNNLVVRFSEGQKMMKQMFAGGGMPGMPPMPGMRRATKKAAKGRKAPAKKKPKGGRPGGPPRPAGSGGQPGAVPDGLRGAGRASPEPALGGGLGGGLPPGLAKPGAGDDLAAGLEALARGNPGFGAVPEDDEPGTGPRPTDLPAGFGRFRRDKRGGR